MFILANTTLSADITGIVTGLRQLSTSSACSRLTRQTPVIIRDPPTTRNRRKIIHALDNAKPEVVIRSRSPGTPRSLHEWASLRTAVPRSPSSSRLRPPRSSNATSCVCNKLLSGLRLQRDSARTDHPRVMTTARPTSFRIRSCAPSMPAAKLRVGDRVACGQPQLPAGSSPGINPLCEHAFQYIDVDACNAD